MAEAYEMQRRAAEQFLISGHIDEGLAVLREFLSLVGMRLPETPKRALLSLLLRRAHLRLRCHHRASFWKLFAFLFRQLAMGGSLCVDGMGCLLRASTECQSGLMRQFSPLIFWRMPPT